MQRSPSSGGGQGAGTDQPNQQPNYDQPYRITITFGNVTKPTPQCSLTWKFYNCEDIHEKMECDSPIILPITNAGEFKSVWFTFVVPKEYKKTNLSLIFSTTTPKDIASITVEQPDPRQPTYALINIAGGTKQ
jgi:hypothetical protein